MHTMQQTNLISRPNLIFFKFQVRILIGQKKSIHIVGYFCKPLYHTKADMTQTAKGIVCTTKHYTTVCAGISTQKVKVWHENISACFLAQCRRNFRKSGGTTTNIQQSHLVMTLTNRLSISDSANAGWAMVPCCDPFAEPQEGLKIWGKGGSSPRYFEQERFPFILPKFLGGGPILLLHPGPPILFPHIFLQSHRKI